MRDGVTLCDMPLWCCYCGNSPRYNDVILGAMASQMTILTIGYSTVYSAANKNPSKLGVTGLCAGNSPMTGEFTAQMASNAENVSIS